MWPFSPPPRKETKPVEPKQIELRAEDDLLTRAEKIVAVMGIVGANGEFVLSCYRVLKSYQELDSQKPPLRLVK